MEKKSDTPRLTSLCYIEKATPSVLYANYLATYVERGVNAILSLKDRRQFEAFLRLLARRVGQRGEACRDRPERAPQDGRLFGRGRAGAGRRVRELRRGLKAGTDPISICGKWQI